MSGSIGAPEMLTALTRPSSPSHGNAARSPIPTDVEFSGNPVSWGLLRFFYRLTIVVLLAFAIVCLGVSAGKVPTFAVLWFTFFLLLASGTLEVSVQRNSTRDPVLNM